MQYGDRLDKIAVTDLPSSFSYDSSILKDRRGGGGGMVNRAMQIRRSVMIYKPNPQFKFRPESELRAKMF